VGNQQLYKEPLEIKIEKPNVYQYRENDQDEKYTSISPGSFGTGQIRKKLFVRNSLESLPLNPWMQNSDEVSINNNQIENGNLEIKKENEERIQKNEKDDDYSINNEQLVNKFSNVKNELKMKESYLSREPSGEGEEEIKEEIKDEDVKMDESYKNIFRNSNNFAIKEFAHESSTNYNNIIIEENF
jgi:hypothetical protein